MSSSSSPSWHPPQATNAAAAVEDSGPAEPSHWLCSPYHVPQRCPEGQAFGRVKKPWSRIRLLKHGGLHGSALPTRGELFAALSALDRTLWGPAPALGRMRGDTHARYFQCAWGVRCSTLTDLCSVISFLLSTVEVKTTGGNARSPTSAEVTRDEEEVGFHE
jgi:hypothetical protein